MNKLVNFFGFIVITTTAILTINYFIFGLSKKQTYPNKNEFIQNRIENGNPHVNSFEAILTESLIPNCANNIIYKYNMDNNSYKLSFICNSEFNVQTYLNIANKESGERTPWVFKEKKNNRYFFYGKIK